ncbi:hypothetical protein XAC3810_200044 [Xanthomonas citri pv. citri]|uniref:Uncharacterized protein n=1 Tax=Xanthomonas citri pv. citri TaxID=611301 RepID=A0A0U5F914_XANCI|nr:hypothetical protein XAC9322_170044 [Xanthomonas citri pv. citri]CEE19079.1 hypothetical protein XAC3824_170043 [Xanthomonas citri pv. citri]CEE20074.1 hypothetical protein XAC1083_180045 [Xanthomonas citri pv. citri]CEE28118.1 hypothetical protein XAC3810_200044 [Xanthomonas citri pv. citri]CEE34232.1 hypothetical protein XAC908_270042 [Xanthomonas citri pv. citri]
MGCDDTACLIASTEIFATCMHVSDDSACCTECSTWRISAYFVLAPIGLKTFVSDTSALEHLRALALLNMRPRKQIATQ